MYNIYKPKIKSNRMNTVPRQRRQKLDRRGLHAHLTCKCTGPIVVINPLEVFQGCRSHRERVILLDLTLD